MAMGIDVGGTFTDVVRVAPEGVIVAKVSTTPDQSVGVLSGALAAGADREPLLVHGTTAATNALLQKRGATVVLLTDDGYLDVIEIGRSDRPSLYDSYSDRPTPLVPRSHRLGIGHPDLSIRVGELRPDVVVVALKDAYLSPAGELAVREDLQRHHPDLDVVLSHQIANEFREFERTSTAVVAGYLRTSIERYLTNLVAAAVPDVAAEILIMQSSGGVTPASEAAANPAGILLSGPAGGVAAAAEATRRIGIGRAVSFDMGGTSTDVCRIEGGQPVIRQLTSIDGYPCLAPTVAIHTVGAGGGSIAWRDPGGSLQVGPQSAGALPGPAGYGRGGTQPTVTDANIVLGRIAPDAVFGEGVAIDPEAARAAVERLGEFLGLDPTETALGIVDVVESHMERAIQEVSVREGHDLRTATLVAFGGAGGLHAVALAEGLGMNSVLVPNHSGVFSAVGLLLSPIRSDITVPSRDLAIDGATDLRSRAVNLAQDTFIQRVGTAPDGIEVSAEMRYAGQSHETRVRFDDHLSDSDLVEAFHNEHKQRNGFSRPDDGVELVTMRATAVGAPRIEANLAVDLEDGRTDSSRPVVTRAGVISADVWKRSRIQVDHHLDGPVLIEDSASTIWIPEGYRVLVLAGGELEVTR